MRQIIHKGDGVILQCGMMGVVMSTPFKMHSYDPDYYCVVIDLEFMSLPVDLRAIAEVHRGGNRIDDLPTPHQLPLL